MLLLIDVGNTHTVLALAAGQEILPPWRLTSDPIRKPEEIESLLSERLPDLSRIKAIALASVVPEVAKNLETALTRLFDSVPLLFVSCEKNLGISLDVESPETLGADRIVNALAAHRLYGDGKKDLLVVDIGTAVTFDLIGRQGNFKGGAIAPGPATLAKSLSHRTAQLPEITPFEGNTLPNPVGRDTNAALQSGITFGFLGMLEGLILRISSGCEERPLVIATGGFSRKISEHCGQFDFVDPLLTLRGLSFFCEQNR